MKHYDYIFTGGGLSALMTVYRMAISGKFDDKSILLLDNNAKNTNDRTWCFWERPNGEFENIVYKKWDSALFGGEHFRRMLDLNPYQYKMIRGIDFYNLAFEFLLKHPNITFIQEKVVDFSDDGQAVSVKTQNQNFTCGKLFNSIFNPQLALSQEKYPVLQQHFLGWFIKTGGSGFNPQVATFMDFSVEQRGNTRFMYVLPISEKEALIEYTLFSKNLLPQEEYESAIKSYIKKLGISEYEIVDKEQGSIPMTAYPFWENNTKNILNIGSAGGWTKASTGYTFKNTVKKSNDLIAFLQKETDFTKFYQRNRFWFYDLLLLDILSKKNELGGSIFSAMFRLGKPSLILKFLDEETTIFQDLKVILKCPKTLFIKALYRRAFK